MSAELLEATWANSATVLLPLWNGESAVVSEGDTVTYYQQISGPPIFVGVRHEACDGVA